MRSRSAHECAAVEATVIGSLLVACASQGYELEQGLGGRQPASSSAQGGIGGAGGALPSACPSEPPVHGSRCDSSVASPCTYEDCDNDTKVAASCSDSRWSVDYSACAPPGCLHWGKNYSPCEINSLCVNSTENELCAPHPNWECPMNPCVHQPLSCACADVVCGPFLDCVEAAAGQLTCAPKPAGPHVPIVLATGLSYAHSLVKNGTHAYWIRNGDIERVPLSGGQIEWLGYLTGYWGSLTVDANYLYIADDSAAELRRFSLTTQAELVLDSVLPPVNAIASNDELVLWNSSNELLTIPKTGGPASLLATTFNTGDASLDATQVFFIQFGQTYAVPLSEGDPTFLNGDIAHYIALDEANIYLVQRGFAPNSGKVLKLPKTGGVSTELASGLNDPTAVVVDDVHVYVAHDEGYIARLPKSGGSLEVFLAGEEVTSLAVDDGYLYWLNPLCHRLQRALK